MTQHLVRTTMQPWRLTEVSDDELLDLQRMGVVASVEPSELSQVPAPTPLVGKTQEVTTDGQGQEEVAQSEPDSGQAPPATQK